MAKEKRIYKVERITTETFYVVDTKQDYAERQVWSGEAKPTGNSTSRVQMVESYPIDKCAMGRVWDVES